MYILTQVQIPMQVAPHGVYVAYDPYAYACASVYAHAYAYAFAFAYYNPSAGIVDFFKIYIY